MNYIVSTIVANYIIKNYVYKHIKNKTIDYTWYFIKYPFVYIYKNMHNKTNTNKDIPDDYEVLFENTEE